MKTILIYNIFMFFLNFERLYHYHLKYCMTGHSTFLPYKLIKLAAWSFQQRLTLLSYEISLMRTVSIHPVGLRRHMSMGGRTFLEGQIHLAQWSGLESIAMCPATALMKRSRNAKV